MTRQRRHLLTLFQDNTGGRTTIRPPRLEPGVTRLTGYQVSRIKKFKWQGRVD